MRPLHADHPIDIARPFIWVAGVSFSTGLLGYMAWAAHAAFG